MKKPILNIADLELNPEVIEYPDSGKFGILAEYAPAPDGKPQGFRFVGKESLSLDYWEGEGKSKSKK